MRGMASNRGFGRGNFYQPSFQYGNNFQNNFQRGAFRGRGRGRGFGQTGSTQNTSTAQNNEREETPAQNQSGESQTIRTEWKCLGCEGTSYHKITDCNTFITANIDKKFDIMHMGGYCWICFTKGHRARDCDKPTLKCTKCGGNHNTILHPESSTQ